MQNSSAVCKLPGLIAFVVMLFLSAAVNKSHAQLKYRVLFLGNSYTDVNNLPQIIKDAALSAGDTLVYDYYVPGGYRLTDLTIDPNSRNKIMAGNWDYVVIQGQSQESITFSNDFFSGGTALNNLIKQYNPCAVIMTYMTWGRKTGDASNCPSFPVMCTYQGMDTTIRNRYLNLTERINGEVSPVSVVWNSIRQSNPDFELYQSDQSHPSPMGSYAAACSFYTMLFKKDPSAITFNFTLNAADAAIIKQTAKTIVYQNLQSWDFKKLPTSTFAYSIGPGINEIIFSPISHGTQQNYLWDFGDGTTSVIPNPTHSFSSNGQYNVVLTTSNCDLQGVHSSVTDTIIEFCAHTPTVYSSPALLCHYDTLWTQNADSYKWFVYGTPLPETRQRHGRRWRPPALASARRGSPQPQANAVPNSPDRRPCHRRPAGPPH